VRGDFLYFYHNLINICVYCHKMFPILDEVINNVKISIETSQFALKNGQFIACSILGFGTGLIGVYII
jgi:hypothetical protein